MARRALDYLVGFTLSPVLWRKLPGSRSAGRVQSVALRLICEREAEIEVFKTREYWTVDALFGTAKKQTLKARLTHLDGRKLDKFDLDTQERAEQAKREIERRAFSVASIDRRQVRRNPPPPFITSTLQQEASRKLGVGAATAMRIAQRLYEGVDIGGETVGLITYMRTDGVQLAPEAIGQTRRLIETKYGQSYLPEKPRVYTLQGQERPGGARGDPPDRPVPHAAGRRRLSGQGPARPLRADLEAHRRQPDGKRRARPGRRSTSPAPTRPCSCAPPARS